ncbi:MAG: hypothetical protein GY865_18830 [candidate division Zixibacteria bacterium]|nr:hypothetical protein [candidate division Zixibacteria bacterium]
MTVPELFENGTEYFPMTDGDTWYYTWADSAKTIKREISGDTVINSVTCARVLENDSTAQAWSKDVDGFYVHLLVGIYKFRFYPPLAIPFNMEEGLPFNYASNIYFQDQAEQYIASGTLDFMGYISKTVQAGSFDDVIELYYQPDDETNYYEYYAPDVGLLDNGDYVLDSAYIDGIWYR